MDVEISTDLADLLCFQSFLHSQPVDVENLESSPYLSIERTEGAQTHYSSNHSLHLIARRRKLPACCPCVRPESPLGLRRTEMLWRWGPLGGSSGFRYNHRACGIRSDLLYPMGRSNCSQQENGHNYWLCVPSAVSSP